MIELNKDIYGDGLYLTINDIMPSDYKALEDIYHNYSVGIDPGNDYTVVPSIPMPSSIKPGCKQIIIPLLKCQFGLSIYPGLFPNIFSHIHEKFTYKMMLAQKFCGNITTYDLNNKFINVRDIEIARRMFLQMISIITQFNYADYTR